MKRLAEARSRTDLGARMACNRAFRENERYEDGPLRGERTVDNVVGEILASEQQYAQSELLRIVRRNLGG